MELSVLQKEIVESESDKVVVIASAACGKTRTLTERVRYWLQQGIEPAQICAITFTNVAANEMQVRLADDYKDKMFIGTIHSLAARFLTMGGYGAECGKAIENENFDELFIHVQKHPDCIQKYGYVLVDEAQDLSFDEFRFIFKMIDPPHYFVVGDYRQSIYGNLNKATADYMIGLTRNSDVKTYNLNENYRNKANILARAKKTLKLIGMNDDSKPMSVGGMVYEGRFNIDTLTNWMEDTNSFKDWAVLCYTQREVEKIQGLLDDCDIPNINFNQRKKTKKELDRLVAFDGVKVLTVWAAKGLGFPYVAVYGRNWMYNKKGRSFKEEAPRVDYVAYTRAMDTLMILT